MGFSRQEYWNGLPFPSPGDLPDPGIEPGSPSLHMDSLPSEPSGDTEMNRMRALQTLTVWMIRNMDKNGNFLWFFFPFYFHLFTYLESLAFLLNNSASGTSLVVQWLRLCTLTAGDMSSIPGQGTKIPHAAWWPKQTNKKMLIHTNKSVYGITSKIMNNIFQNSPFSWTVRAAFLDLTSW